VARSWICRFPRSVTTEAKATVSVTRLTKAEEVSCSLAFVQFDARADESQCGSPQTNLWGWPGVAY
jgi:hypothetical protein